MTEPWYYEIAGQGYGPITLDALKQLAADGTVTAATLVRQGARGRWERADRYKGLLGDASTKATPPSASPLRPPPIRAQAAPQPMPPPVQHKPPPVQQAVAAPALPPPSFSPPPTAAPAPPSAASAYVAPAPAASDYGVSPAAAPAQSTASASPAGDFSSSLPRVGVAAGGSASHRAPRYDALITVAKLYGVLAWVCLALGALGVVACLGLAVVAVATGRLGWQASLFTIGSQVVAAAVLALYVFLMFITLRALSQAILLAMDVERNTRRSNELLTDIRDHFRGGS